MVLWSVYLSLCLLGALNAASVEKRSPGSNSCGACWSGWSAFGCRCFKFFYSYQTWAGAEKFCLENDANLASVHSHDEYMFIQRLVRHATHATTRAWIGGSDAAQEGVWFWSDGSKMSYQIWAPGNPSNYAGSEHCLEMNYDNGKWNDDKCYTWKPFVCAK